MKLTILEESSDKLKVEIIGENHTLLNVLREKCWDAGASQAAYMIEHPYLSTPKIVIKGKNPKKILKSAAQLVVDDAKDFQKQLKKA